MLKIFVLTSDLIFKTRIQSIIKSLNLSTNYIEQIDNNIVSSSNTPMIIIVDLEHNSLDFSYILKLRSNAGDRIYLIGYCPHVREDLIKNANKSGFDLVLPRSKFVYRLPEILKNFEMQSK